MRILEALTGALDPLLSGIVEADEKFFRESRKGSREWVNHERYPTLFAKPDRPRWRDYKRLGLLRRTGPSKYQISVLTVTDRSGTRHAEVLPDRHAEKLIAVLDRQIGPDTVLCSDGDAAYASFARQRRLPHYRLYQNTGPRVIETAFHIQTINNLHSRFERFMKPFCGPATKNLQGYTAWFIQRLKHSQPHAVSQTWQRLLAA